MASERVVRPVTSQRTGKGSKREYVLLLADRVHCGSCGQGCVAGASCRNGACRAEIQVACYATGDVRPVTADLSPAGDPFPANGSPTVLVAQGDVIYTGNGFPAGVGIFSTTWCMWPDLESLMAISAGDRIRWAA